MTSAFPHRIAFLGAAGVVCAVALGVAGTAKAEDLRPLWSKQNGQLVPLTVSAGKSEERFFADTVVFIHEDAKERVVYTWELAPAVADGPAFGKIRCQVTAAGGEGPPVTIPVASNAVLEWDGDVGKSQSKWMPAGEGKFQMLRQFQVGKEIASLKITGQLAGKSLVLEVLCDKPLVARCTPGDWGTGEYKFVAKPTPPKEEEKKDAKPAATKEKPPAKVPPQDKWTAPTTAGKWMQRVAVPFLEHEVRAFPEEKVFAASFSDWRISNDAVTGEYPKLSDGSRNPLVARYIYTASKDIREVLPNIPHGPSPFRAELGKRAWFQLDIDYPFDTAFGYLERLAKRGMRDYLLLLTVWQNKGPEAGLPLHFPAKGKEEEIKSLEKLGDTCGKLGIPFALQEEYTDMHSEFDEEYDKTKSEFSSRVADKYLCRDTEGALLNGYKKRGNVDPPVVAGIIRPDLWLEFAEDQGSDIHKEYESTAAYLHRHLSNPLTRSIDYTAREKGAGTARHVFEATSRLFAQQRKIHEGPVLGNGGPHWRYSGLIDGVTAQPGAGWKAGGGQTMPLLVDFDLLRNHPLNVSFGMGRLSNWQLPGSADNNGFPPWDGGTPMIVLDQYRMQEVIFGHAAFLGGDFSLDEGHHFLENFLVLPVAKAYAGANPVEISYRVNGAWVDASTALWAEDLSVVRVKYENGLEIVANSGEATLDADGIELPQFGWVARQGEGLLAYTALVNGAVVDHARSPDGLFINARRFDDWKDSQSLDGFTAAAQGINEEWQVQHLNDGIDPVEMGGIRTNGCVHLRKVDREWVLTTFPKDAQFEVQLKGEVFRAPFEVNSVEGAAKGVKPESVDGGAWWNLPLNGAFHYRFPAAR